MATSFVQKANLFAYSGADCLRNDYYHNDCTLCIDVCPEGAFHIVRNKLMLFDNECIECAACIGGCPSEALSIESFDPNAFSVAFKEQGEPLLSCKKNTPCLGVFDAHHLLTMALRAESVPVCDMAHCEGCSLNKEQKVETRIREAIAAANLFFEETGLETRIETREEKPEENARRALFRKAFDKAKATTLEGAPAAESLTEQYHKRQDTDMPLKYVLLKNSIKEKIESFTTTSLTQSHSLFFNKTISFEACTNCGDCIQFCPTKALFASSDKQGIYFTQGKCIGCGICEHICKTDAIGGNDKFDLVSIAFDRAEQMVHYEMVMCHECRCPYPYKGGDPICDRCKDFSRDFSDMFTMAKDL